MYVPTIVTYNYSDSHQTHPLFLLQQYTVIQNLSFEIFKKYI